MTAPASIWDNPELRPDSGEYIKFDNVGDTAAGIVQKISVHRWDDGSTCPKVSLVDDNGEERTLTAGQIRLKMALTEQRPEQGDHVSITLSQVEKRAGGKTLKHFDVVVTRGGKPATQAPAPAATITPTAAPTPPAAPVDNAAVAAALAALTPEQRAAMGLPA